MEDAFPFRGLLETIDGLPLEEQEALIEILHWRFIEQLWSYWLKMRSSRNCEPIS